MKWPKSLQKSAQLSLKPIEFKKTVFLFIVLLSHIVYSSSAFADVSEELLQVPQDLPAEVQELYESMSEEDKGLFIKKRSSFLNFTQKSLTKMDWALGRIAIFKEKRKLKKFLHEKEVMEIESYNYTDSVRADMMAGLLDSETEFYLKHNEQMQKPLKQVSKELIDRIIKALDGRIWQQAPLFAKTNEFGFMLAGGLLLESGNPEKGFGGLIDFGISIGFNMENKALAIQILYDVEKYRTTLMPQIFIGGAVGKAGVYIANQKNEMNTKGTSFYPALAPGFSSTTSNSAAAGFSTGLTWPPSPLGDVLTYENSLKKNVVLRLTISPMTKGFVRLQTSLSKSSFNFLLIPFQKLFGARSLKCEALF